MNLFSSETLLTGRGAIISALSTCFGFISSNVVRRDYWQKAAAQVSLESYFKGYVHLYLIASMLDEQSVWVCLPKRLVAYRTGNDSFRPDDEFARTRLDVVGYDLGYGDTLGRGSRTYRNAMKRVATICIRGHFLNAKVQGVSHAYWREAIPTTVAHYWRYPGFWIRTLPVAFVPGRALLAVRSLYRRTIRPIRDRRRVREGGAA